MNTSLHHRYLFYYIHIHDHTSYLIYNFITSYEIHDNILRKFNPENLHRAMAPSCVLSAIQAKKIDR